MSTLCRLSKMRYDSFETLLVRTHQEIVKDCWVFPILIVESLDQNNQFIRKLWNRQFLFNSTFLVAVTARELMQCLTFFFKDGLFGTFLAFNHVAKLFIISICEMVAIFAVSFGKDFNSQCVLYLLTHVIQEECQELMSILLYFLESPFWKSFELLELLVRGIAVICIQSFHHIL